jgi:hypothetical protein
LRYIVSGMDQLLSKTDRQRCSAKLVSIVESLLLAFQVDCLCLFLCRQ